MFSCIYCLKSEPSVKPSEAHIFPDSIGGITSSRTTVCEACNWKINKNVEMLAVNTFNIFNSIWGIKGRRNKIRGVKATVQFDGKEGYATLDGKGEPKTGVVLLGKDDRTGKRTYSVIGPLKKVKERQEEIQKKHPDYRWEAIDLKKMPPPQVIFEQDENLANILLRRLATKVAFERWAQLRNSFLLSDHQYDPIRDFILEGKERKPLCGVLSNSTLLNGLINFQPPDHAVVILSHPQSSYLGAFVTFYSLFCYWVLLSTNYQSLGPVDYLLLEDPQNKKVKNPIFRTDIGSIFISWDSIVNEYYKDIESNARKAMDYAGKKLESVYGRDT